MSAHTLREEVARIIVDLRKPGGRSTIEEDRAVDQIFALFDRPSVGEVDELRKIVRRALSRCASTDPLTIMAESVVAALATAPSPPVGQERDGWRSMDELPDVGRKFIALFNDGSGAAMFWRHDCGFIDSDGDEYESLSEHSFDRWTYLPDLEFWCEERAEDPIVLRLPPPPEGEAP